MSRVPTLAPLFKAASGNTVPRIAKATDPFYLSPAWRALIAEIIAERGRRCEDPKCKTPGATGMRVFGDHVIEIADCGAALDKRNILLRCGSCHTRKTIEQRAKRLASRGDWQSQAHPDWLRPSRVPLTIVCGPPASGKSTYVQRRAAQDDLVLDLDLIAAKLSGMAVHAWSRQWLDRALGERNRVLGQLSGSPLWPAAWLIVGEPQARWRDWWRTKLRPVAVIVIETPDHVCLARLAADPARAHMGRDQAQSVHAWWNEYTPSPTDKIISKG